MTLPNNIEPTLLKLLNKQRNEPFTIPELTAEYLELSDEHRRTEKNARQFVRRNVVRLFKAGVLIQAATSKKGKARYSVFGLQLEQKPSTQRQKIASMRTTLIEKLHQHRIELLTAIGEREAYDDLCNELPELFDTIQPHYDAARDRSSKLLGRVRALESVIATQSATPS